MSNTTFKDLVLNNGETAIFKGVDFWGRPYYAVKGKSGKEYLACCTNLNGTNLTVYTDPSDPDSEPNYRLNESLQPSPSNYE